MKYRPKPTWTTNNDRGITASCHAAIRLARSARWCLTIVVVLSIPVAIGAADPQKNNDAEERRLRNELKEREQEIQKLKKELADERADTKKLGKELDSWRKKPVVPNDNVALSPYDASDLFAKEQPAGSGSVVFEIRKGATLLLVWKHGSGGKSVKWEYVTARLMPSSNTKEIRLNLHKGDWSVYRSNPKAGYAHLGDLKVTDKPSTITIPDE